MEQRKLLAERLPQHEQVCLVSALVHNLKDNACPLAFMLQHLRNGYAPYNPSMVQKMLDVLRVFHNFTLVSATDKKTPAMRLGLANGVVTYEDILYFAI